MDNTRDAWEMDKDRRFKEMMQEEHNDSDKSKKFVEELKKFQRKCMDARRR